MPGLSLFWVLALSMCLVVPLKAESMSEVKNFLKTHMKKASTRSTSSKRTAVRPKVFQFTAQNKPLVDLVNELAALSGINILLPQGALAITAKVNYTSMGKMSLEAAWDRLQFILSLAGYTIRPKEDMLAIVKNDGTVKREVLPIYINEPLSSLPSTDQVIRAVFFLSNIDLSNNTIANSITQMLTDILSKESSDIKMNPKTNSLILTDRAHNIKEAMLIIHELDQGGTRDAIEVVPLFYSEARMVEQLFTRLVPQAPATPAFGPQQPTPAAQGTYFPKNTKVIALERHNAMVIMGTHHAIELVKDFIIKYIDLPPVSGDSILHVYDLQYLDAQKFEPVLQGLVNPAQADQAKGKVATGAKQYFKDVIIKAEITRKTQELAPTTATNQKTQTVSQPKAEGIQQGGNRLIIAARKKDWIRIKDLIGQLDKPQPQVAIEVLVLDINLSSNKILGNQMRDTKNFQNSVSDNMNYQTALLGAPVLKPDDGGVTPADALMANLLQLVNNPGSNLATNAPWGSTVVSFTDGNTGVWSVWEILNRFTTTTIIAQPFVAVANHQKSTTIIKEERFLLGNAFESGGGSISIPNRWVDAAIAIDIQPNISNQTGTINLNVIVTINEFLNTASAPNTTDAANIAASGNRTNRVIQTNANVGNGEVLALGGLARLRDNVDITGVPLLQDIPLIGWWFKRETKIKEKTMLAVFLSPTIIEPLKNGGIDTFTRKKLSHSRFDLESAVNFENLRDPITRWFFQPDPTYPQQVVGGYVNRASKAYPEEEKLEEYGPDTTDIYRDPGELDEDESLSAQRQAASEKRPGPTPVIHKKARNNANNRDFASSWSEPASTGRAGQSVVLDDLPDGSWVEPGSGGSSVQAPSRTWREPASSFGSHDDVVDWVSDDALPEIWQTSEQVLDSASNRGSMSEGKLPEVWQKEPQDSSVSYAVQEDDAGDDGADASSLTWREPVAPQKSLAISTPGTVISSGDEPAGSWREPVKDSRAARLKELIAQEYGDS